MLKARLTSQLGDIVQLQVFRKYVLTFGVQFAVINVAKTFAESEGYSAKANTSTPTTNEFKRSPTLATAWLLDPIHRPFNTLAIVASATNAREHSVETTRPVWKLKSK